MEQVPGNFGKQNQSSVQIYEALRAQRSEQKFLTFALRVLNGNRPARAQVTSPQTVAETVERFLQQFPSVETFDALFNEQEVTRLQELIRNERSNSLKEGLISQLASVRQRQKEDYPVWRAVLYGAAPQQTVERSENYISLLSYQDAPLPEEQLLRMRENTEASEQARKYADALTHMAHQVGSETIETLTLQLHAQMLEEAVRLEIPISPYGHSKTWVMWDIGKQHYFVTHSNEADRAYKRADATDLYKQDEIVDRHIGWEAYLAYAHHPQWRQKIDSESKWKDARRYLTMAPKENGTLGSYELAALGKALRTAWDPE